MDKEVMLLKSRIDELELENCEAQHKIEELEKKIASMNVAFNTVVDVAVENPPVVSMFTKDKGILDGKPGTDADFHKEAKENEK